MELVLSYDASVALAPPIFKTDMQIAANMIDSLIHNNITVNIQVGYNEFYNGVITGLGSSAVGGDANGTFVSYPALRTALASHETTTLNQTMVNSLPNTTSVNGQSGFYVPSAVEKALGMMAPNAPGVDGVVGIGSGIPSSNLVGVALHELTHAMGRETGAGTFDLARYTSPGVHLFSSNNTAPASYFSVDGGVTKLADYGQNSDPSDFLLFGVQDLGLFGATDPFDEFYGGSTLQAFTVADGQQLNAMGFDTSVNPAVPEPATWLMLLAGFLMVGVLSYVRQFKEIRIFSAA